MSGIHPFRGALAIAFDIAPARNLRELLVQLCSTASAFCSLLLSGVSELFEREARRRADAPQVVEAGHHGGSSRSMQRLKRRGDCRPRASSHRQHQLQGAQSSDSIRCALNNTSGFHKRRLARTMLEPGPQTLSTTQGFKVPQQTSRPFNPSSHRQPQAATQPKQPQATTQPGNHRQHRQSHNQATSCSAPARVIQ